MTSRIVHNARAVRNTTGGACATGQAAADAGGFRDQSMSFASLPRSL
jgi:hypothetical protein